jgi:hypothetical protein
MNSKRYHAAFRYFKALFSNQANLDAGLNKSASDNRADFLDIIIGELDRWSGVVRVRPERHLTIRSLLS